MTVRTESAVPIGMQSEWYIWDALKNQQEPSSQDIAASDFYFLNSRLHNGMKIVIVQQS